MRFLYTWPGCLTLSTAALYFPSSDDLSRMATWQRPFLIYSDEWWVLCKLFHISSDLLISKCWHLDPLSSVLWAELLFHHLIDISSLLYFYSLSSKLLLPTALPRSNYAADVYHFLLMKLFMRLGSFRIPRCYIYTVVPIFFICSCSYVLCVVVILLFTYWACNDSSLLCGAPSMAPNEFSAISTSTKQWNFVTPFCGKCKEASLSLFKYKL